MQWTLSEENLEVSFEQFLKIFAGNEEDGSILASLAFLKWENENKFI